MKRLALIYSVVVAFALLLIIAGAQGRTTSSVEVTNLTASFAKPGKVTLTWALTSEANVINELLEERQGTGPWTKLPLLGPAVRSETVALAAGEWHFRVWAVVKAGSRETGGTVTAEAPKEEPKTEGKEQTTYAAVGAPVLTDKEAAERVIHKPEIRTYQEAENDYEPTEAEVLAGRNDKDQYGQNELQENPYLAKADGKDGLFLPSTDDLIQWACDKWGLPVETCRAVMVDESWWRQNTKGDLATEPAKCVEQAPLYARKSATEVYESLGISQVKWRCAESPSGSGIFNYPVGAGSNPMRWKSTAYALDRFAATIRFFRDNPEGKRSSWGDSSYKAGETMGAFGEWFSPYPANNSGALSWIKVVEKYQAERFWTKPEFVNG